MEENCIEGLSGVVWRVAPLYDFFTEKKIADGWNRDDGKSRV